MFNDLQFIGMLLTLVGSFWIVYGHIFGSGEEIKERCFGDYRGMSDDLYVYLDKQRVESIVGFCIIFIGFLLQGTAILYSINFNCQLGLIITAIAIVAIVAPLCIIKFMDKRRRGRN